jgi:L-asparaginase
MEARGVDRLDISSYFERPQRASGVEILGRVGELERFARVEEVEIKACASPAIDGAWWFALARTLRRLGEDPDLAGIVIAHGTNTLEETAWFLDLVLEIEQPVVMTGSMRPSTAISGDGDINLLQAVLVATRPELRNAGVIVSLNGAIHGARDVTKGDTHVLQAFQSPNQGPLGTIENDHTVVVRSRSESVHPSLREALRGSLPEELPRVDVVVSHVGATGDAIDAAVAGGARGIVLAGTGAGIGTPAQEEALTRAHEAGLAVCICSRGGRGSVLETPGRVAAGFVTGDDLLPWKASILLSLALTVTDDPVRLQGYFRHP